jgi:hypothetical protein
MSINPDQIKDEVLELMSDTRSWISKREITQITKEQFTEEMKTKYEYLHKNSSTLFDRCIAGDLNMEQFNYMMSMLKKLNTGKDYQEVSKEVGQKLVDVYVKPMLNDKK